MEKQPSRRTRTERKAVTNIFPKIAQLPESVVRRGIMPFAPLEFASVESAPKPAESEEARRALQSVVQEVRQRVRTACPSARRPSWDAESNRWICPIGPSLVPPRVPPYNVRCCPPAYVATEQDVHNLLHDSVYVSGFSVSEDMDIPLDAFFPEVKQPTLSFVKAYQVDVLVFLWSYRAHTLQFYSRNGPNLVVSNVSRQQLENFLTYLMSRGILHRIQVNFPEQPEVHLRLRERKDYVGSYTRGSFDDPLTTAALEYDNDPVEMGGRQQSVLRVSPGRFEDHGSMSRTKWLMAQIKSEVSDQDVIDEIWAHRAEMLYGVPPSGHDVEGKLRELLKFAERTGRRQVADFILDAINHPEWFKPGQ